MDRAYQVAKWHAGDEVDHAVVRILHVRMIELGQVDASNNENEEAGEGDAAEHVGQ